MTAVAAFRTALVTAIQAQVPTVTVSGVPLGEDTPLREAIWVQRVRGAADWRCIGPASSNRKETLTAELRVHVYREAADQTEASDAAADRCEALFAEIEDAFEADFSLANSVTHGKPLDYSLELRPREEGWVAFGEMTVECENYPAT